MFSKNINRFLGKENQFYYFAKTQKKQSFLSLAISGDGEGDSGDFFRRIQGEFEAVIARVSYWEEIEAIPVKKSSKTKWYQSSGQLPAELRRPENSFFFQFLACIVSRSVFKVVPLKDLRCMSTFELVFVFQFKQCVFMCVYVFYALFLLFYKLHVSLQEDMMIMKLGFWIIWCIMLCRRCFMLILGCIGRIAVFLPCSSLHVDHRW